MTSPTWTRKIEDIAEALHHAGGQCVVLIGAGCSKSAGIPLAGELIREVEQKFPIAHKRVPEADRRNYNKVMAALTTNQRRGLLDPHIDAARVNWAHLALAQLFATGKVDRVLTVNFDPLLVRACAMAGLFPAIYDLATTERFREAHIAPRSLFYLNGQHTGFVTLNTEDELKRHHQRLRDIVHNTGTRRTWVVVGYSGDADPLLDVLAEREIFEGGLYWVGHDRNPSSDLEKKLLGAGKDAFYLGGQDADRFFTELAQRLGCFPPDLLANPFSHVETLVTTHIDFSTGGDSGRYHEETLKRLIAKANAAMPEWKRDADVNAWLLAGEYQRVLDWYAGLSTPSDEDRSFAAWAHVDLGNRDVAEAAKYTEGDLPAARHLWAAAAERYVQALAIEPDMHAAANNWGNALHAEAQAVAPTDLAEARRLWAAAAERYAQALAIKPDMHDAAYNWGIALSAEARAAAPTNLAEARRLWAAAAERYAQALTIKPDMHEAAYNWGNALNGEARTVAPTNLAEVRHLWAAAAERYAQALAIKPDMHDAAYNWGYVLAAEAQAIAPNDLAEARHLWAAAAERYAQALAIKPDMHDAANNWGGALDDEAQAIAPTDLAEARRLWAAADERYAQTLAIKPDMHEAAYNWGNALDAEAQVIAPTDLAEARRLWATAAERYAQALAMKPDMYEAATNLGTVLAAAARAVVPTDLAEARRLWAAAAERYAQALAIKPHEHEAACNWGIALTTEAQAVAPTDLTEARRLWTAAAERYAQALAIKPDMHEAAYNWCGMLLTQYHLLKPSAPDEAAPLLDQAEQLALRAESIRPGAATYNLACVRSLKGDLSAALEALRSAHAANALPDAAHLRTDPDLAPLRADPAFQTWWRELFGPDEPLDAPAG